jgi:hypothetical protein
MSNQSNVCEHCGGDGYFAITSTEKDCPDCNGTGRKSITCPSMLTGKPCSCDCHKTDERCMDCTGRKSELTVGGVLDASESHHHEFIGAVGGVGMCACGAIETYPSPPPIKPESEPVRASRSIACGCAVDLTPLKVSNSQPLTDLDLSPDSSPEFIGAAKQAIEALITEREFTARLEGLRIGRETANQTLQPQLEAAKEQAEIDLLTALLRLKAHPNKVVASIQNRLDKLLKGTIEQ